ncbi:GAF domain-containing protein [Silvibacterium acidisoli]|uniref:GAF domain-containing protein n=1 Tax=Acidobacteriaceae bacterium ZG23-2 TaxID=2883246 RepID=UPI00406D0486
MTETACVSKSDRSVWPAGGDEMGALIRTYDWTSTPLGATESWPQTLRTAVDLALASPVAAIILWGPEHLQIYNALWTKLHPGKHPVALGKGTHDCFQELAGTLDPIYRRVSQGEGVVLTDSLLPVMRRGKIENAWWNVIYTPIRGDSGKVEGIFCTLAETTDKVLAEVALRESQQRQAFLLNLHDTTRRLSHPAQVQNAAMKLLAEYFDVMRATYFEVDPDQDTFRLTARYERDPAPIPEEMHLSDFSADIAEAYRQGRTLLMSDTEIEAQSETYRAAYRAISVRAWAAVPLVRKGQLVAIVGVQSRTPRQWAGPELRLLEDVAERTWANVELAQVEGTLAEELTAITRVHDLTERLLSITDLSTALGEVLDAAIVHYGADRGTVQFHDPEADVLRYAASRGFDPRDLYAIPPVDRDFHSTCAVAIRTRQRVIASDLITDPAWGDHAPTAATLGYRAAVSTPLKTRRDDLQGVLSVHFKDAHVPTESELRWADLYSRLAAHLIERGRAENALRQAEKNHRVRLEEEVANRTAELQVRVAERDALLQEVHHRVKNNLHVITSMLEMQARRSDDLAAVSQLEEACNRVMSISHIHELLYQSGSFSAVDLTAYAAMLVPQLVAFYDMQNRVEVVMEGESVSIDLERAVPCGLLLNELVSNACKHAFPSGETGRLKVRLAQADQWVHLSVQDSGVGLSPDFDFASSETLGLTIVRLLITQLGGHLSLRNGDGTTVEMKFLASLKRNQPG